MKAIISCILLCLYLTACAQHAPQAQHGATPPTKITVGAERMEIYMELLYRQRIALVVNQTSLVEGKHLVDTLLGSGVNIVRIFSPEHGFRGEAGAGEHVADGKDPKTGIPVVSLYGKNKKPLPEHLADVDIVIFDIQDVGVRFYTYISTMALVMEACSESQTKFLILDRPNPNGHYVDGPVLEAGNESFVGMLKIPMVYGLTIGELARLVDFEKWLPGGKMCPILVVPLDGYTHSTPYTLPVAPSPNLKDMKSIYLYPSICLFEGTVVSEGRGTDKPFQMFGHPDYGALTLVNQQAPSTFTPQPNAGSSSPKLMGKLCKGYDLSKLSEADLRGKAKIDLSYLLDFYKNMPDKEHFFLETGFFNLLAGNKTLMQQIKDGKTEAEIRASWKKDLDAFKELRAKYLLYPE